MNNLKLKNFLIEEIGDVKSVTKYLPKNSFNEFQNNLQKITEDLRNKIKTRVLGKEVTFYGSKGFGQIVQPYTSNITEVAIVLYQDKYLIMFRGTEGKSKKQNEYYIDPNENTYMKISSPSAIPPQSNPVKPSPVVPNDNNNNIPAPKIRTLSQSPQQSHQ